MESYGIPAGDLDSLITEEFDSSNSRRNNQENIKSILQSISGISSGGNVEPSRRRFTTLVRNRNPVVKMDQNTPKSMKSIWFIRTY